MKISIPDRTDRQARLTEWLSRTTGWLGSFQAIVMSVGLVVLWVMSGPFFDFSDTWQLMINTPTTVITFWMAFVIQSTQNRDGAAIQTKLDRLLDLMEDDHDLKGLEDKPEAEVREVQEQVRGE